LFVDKACEVELAMARISERCHITDKFYNERGIFQPLIMLETRGTDSSNRVRDKIQDS